MDTITQQRIKRTSAYRKISFFSIVLFFVLGLWFLSSLILPVIFGFLFAYISLPIIAFLQRKGIPKLAGIFILLITFSIILSILFVIIRAQIPDNHEQMEIRLITLNQLNDRYQSFMGIETTTDNNGIFLYRVFGTETDFFMDSLNGFLVLKDDEKISFAGYLNEERYSPDQIKMYANLLEFATELRSYTTGQLLSETLEQSGDAVFAAPESSNISLIMGLFSTWVLLPIIFFFFLLDDGKFKREFIKLIPNEYFEMSLTSFKNVDDSIGNYLRGTAIETIALFITFFVLLLVIGFGLTPSILIALLASIFNIIPFIGPIAGIVISVFYALLLTEVNSIFPFITIDNIVFFAALVAILAQVLDNVYLKPIIVGNAINIHPLLLIISVLAGGIVFGFWGVLLSVPIVMIIKVILSTIHNQLKLYNLINS